MLERVVNQRLGSFGRIALTLQGGRNRVEEAKLRES